MKKDPYAVKYSHGKKITIRPVDGGFVVERYLKGEQVFVMDMNLVLSVRLVLRLQSGRKAKHENSQN